MTHLSHHVINESMLIPDSSLLILLLVLLLIHVSKYLQEAPIVNFQYGVFGGQIQRPADQHEYALSDLLCLLMASWLPACVKQLGSKHSIHGTTGRVKGVITLEAERWSRE